MNNRIHLQSVAGAHWLILEHKNKTEALDKHRQEAVLDAVIVFE